MSANPGGGCAGEFAVLFSFAATGYQAGHEGRATDRPACSAGIPTEAPALDLAMPRQARDIAVYAACPILRHQKTIGTQRAFNPAASSKQQILLDRNQASFIAAS